MIILLLLSFVSYSQTNIDKDILNKIEIGYTTRWDIEQLFGKGERFEKKFLNPDNEQNLGKPGWVHSNGLQYKNKGITFISADDGEIISSIYLTAPFKLTFNELDTIKIGRTLLEVAFPNIDTIKVNTTGASNYWSFSIDRFSYFVAKSIKHRNKRHYSEVPSFKDNLEYYKRQPISIVTIDLYNYERYKKEFHETIKKLYCCQPLYAPKNETHTNCFDMGWPDKVPTLIRPFYALTGGQKSERIKQGYWKEYGPNHRLIYEGEFKDNEEIGLFKFYDQDGNLQRSETFSQSKISWTYLVIIGLVISLVTIVAKKRKKKNAT